MQLGPIDKVASGVGLVMATATGVAKLLLSTQDATRVTHFALFVLSQAWLDVGFLIAVFLAWRLIRAQLPAVRTEYGGAAAVETLVSRHPLQLMLVLALAVLVASPAYFFVRGRVYFWTVLVKRSYVETYKQRIDRLAAAGKVQDAFTLATRISAAVGEEAEEYYLTERLTELREHVERSADLVKQSNRSWNPITERDIYFRHVEALRLNPQNYVAADRIRQMLDVITPGIAEDVQVICNAERPIRSFRGKARSLLEATVQHDDAGTAECSDHGLRESWGFYPVTCFLNLSDATRAGAPAKGCAKTPSTFWEDLPADWQPEDIPSVDQLTDDFSPSFPTPLAAWRSIMRRRE